MDLSCEYTSPNWDERPKGTDVDTVILHYTGMKSGQEALDRLCDPVAAVSAHYLVEIDGRIFKLVAEEKRAWHAGVSCWQGRDNINHSSIGIEMVNPGHEFGYRPFPDVQIQALLALLEGVRSRHSTIPKTRYLGHSDIAPGRKIDPGPLFPWRRLAENGFGVFSDKYAGDRTVALRKGDTGETVINLNKQLGIVGYYGCECDSIGPGTEDALRAFQAHWRPEAVNGTLDMGTAIVLDDIAQLVMAK